MYRYPIKLIKVVDGDTVDVEIDLGFNISFRERVRLYGINAYELREEKGPEAKQFVQGWFSNGDKFVMESHEYNARGKYGRILGTFYRDSEEPSLNKLLVENELAKVNFYKLILE